MLFCKEYKQSGHFSLSAKAKEIYPKCKRLLVGNPLLSVDDHNHLGGPVD